MLKLFKFIIENTFFWFQKSELEVEPKKENNYEDVGKSSGIFANSEK